MPDTKPFFPRLTRTALVLAYAAAAVVFLRVLADFYQPGKGFTILVMFGEVESPRYIPELAAINHYEIPKSSGYDAQWYAQIAMHPQIGDPVLRDAVDSLPYRARRILFCWTAYALAGGDPARALHIYAVQGIAGWIALAILLLRWFPATNWSNFVRWAGVLFSCGMCMSVREALVDGPSLVLIAAGVALVEKGRPWWAAAVLGVAGLGKETNVLAAAAFAAPGEKWRNIVARGAVVALPLLVWLVVLKIRLGEPGNAGFRNFAWPMVGYFQKWGETIGDVMRPPDPVSGPGGLVLLVALTVQFLFFVLWPRWRETWWRIGAVYAALMAVLGEAVWEGYQGAAWRVLLPMTLAFNALVPRGRRWLAVLLVGNATVIFAPDLMRPPPRASYDVEGPRALRIVPGSGQVLDVAFDEEWYGDERSRFEMWRWSKGSAGITLRNPQPFALMADVAFGLRPNGAARNIVVRAGGRELWRGVAAAGVTTDVVIRGARLTPGENIWQFETDTPATLPGNDDPRRVAFSLRNLKVTLTGRE